MDVPNDNPYSGAYALAEHAHAYLNRLKDLGYQGFECSDTGLAAISNWGKPGVIFSPDLESLNQRIKNCTQCRLCENRTQAVSGQGLTSARIIFIGDFPEAEDDESGQIFSGPAGRLLTKILTAMHLDRKDVYLLNVVKCRPPDGRPPTEDETNHCIPFLQNQLQLIRPEFVCTLGLLPTRVLLKQNVLITDVRGNFFDIDGMCIFPTYHPNHLLKYPRMKGVVWQDMQLLMKEMGLLKSFINDSSPMKPET